MSDINITSIILSYLIPATLGAGIGFLSSKLKKDKAKDKAIEEGVQALLRNELVREYREYKAKGPLPDSSSGIPFLYEKLNTRTTSGPCPSYFDGVAVGFSMLVADCGLFFMSDAFAAELSLVN